VEQQKILQDSIDYIESNLKAELSARELADRAGYSLYHYYRIFQKVTGMSVVRYIQRRRLLHGIWEISRGSSGIHAALTYGFDTYAGFYRAFLREFGCTPSQYIQAGRVRIPCRHNLSKENHMIITHKRISELLRHWNLDHLPLQDIYFESTGEKHGHAVLAGTDYVIKFSSDPAKLNHHILLSAGLANQGLIAAEALPTTDGKLLMQDDGLFCCVTRRCTGSHIRPESLYGNNASMAWHIGNALGQLHVALKELDTPLNDVNQLEVVRSWALPKAREAMLLSGELVADYLQTFSLAYPKLPRQIIHRDPNPGNILFDSGKWGFIDFDLTEINARIFDPCYAATAILSETFRPEDPAHNLRWLEICRNILRGYDDAVHLTPEEWAAVPSMILTNQLVCVAWFAEQGNYPQILETNIQMTRFLAEHYRELPTAP